MAREDIYLEAAEKLGYPSSASCIKFLRILFTPEEGELLLEDGTIAVTASGNI